MAPPQIAEEIIRRWMASANRCIPALELQRLVRDILRELDVDPDITFTVEALDAIHEGVEFMLISRFENMNMAQVANADNHDNANGGNAAAGAENNGNGNRENAGAGAENNGNANRESKA